MPRFRYYLFDDDKLGVELIIGATFLTLLDSIGAAGTFGSTLR